jgi:hypothetical protein
MPDIVRTSDFSTGDFKIASNRLTTPDIAVFITQREREYLVRLLGAELYGLFYADLVGTPLQPAAARFTEIFDPNQWDLSCGIRISNGMKYMLQGVVYFHYVKDTNAYHTITGMVESANENSAQDKARGAQIIIQKYSQALETYSAIQDYIKDNLATYPEFNGAAIRQSPIFM